MDTGSSAFADDDSRELSLDFRFWGLGQLVQKQTPPTCVCGAAAHTPRQPDQFVDVKVGFDAALCQAP
jgi:hypothetical protein